MINDIFDKLDVGDKLTNKSIIEDGDGNDRIIGYDYIITNRDKDTIYMVCTKYKNKEYAVSKNDTWACRELRLKRYGDKHFK